MNLFSVKSFLGGFSTLSILSLVTACGDAPPAQTNPSSLPGASPSPSAPLCSEKLGSLDAQDRRLVSADGRHVLTASGLYTDTDVLNLETGKLNTELNALSFSETGDEVLILSRSEARQLPFAEQNLQNGTRTAYTLSIPAKIINSPQVLDYNSEAIYFVLTRYLTEPRVEVQVIRFDLKTQQQSTALRFASEEFLTANDFAYDRGKIYYYAPNTQQIIERDLNATEPRVVYQAPENIGLGIRDFDQNKIAFSYSRNRESERLMIVDLNSGQELWGKDNPDRLQHFGPAHFADSGDLFYLERYSNGWDELRQSPLPFYRSRLKDSSSPSFVFEPKATDIQGGDIGFGDFVILPDQKVLLTAYQQAFELELETHVLRPAQACQTADSRN